ncbi:MAG: thioredoxin family protein [Ignavibacteriae bacterium]|nr:thioredoxin family protein [Ignavibacteriota bacterium]
MTRIVILFLLAAAVCAAQPHATDARIYDPSADAAAALDNALHEAGQQGKHVLVQVGGNWCPWCIRLEKLFASNDTIARAIRDNYVFIRVNYSKENKNLATLERLGYPQRFGFPVLVVLDARGTRLHTQDSGFLEDGKGHSPEKVLTFLSKWTPSALDAKQYLEN